MTTLSIEQAIHRMPLALLERLGADLVKQIQRRVEAERELWMHANLTGDGDARVLTDLEFWAVAFHLSRFAPFAAVPEPDPVRVASAFSALEAGTMFYMGSAVLSESKAADLLKTKTAALAAQEN